MGSERASEDIPINCKQNKVMYRVCKAEESLHKEYSPSLGFRKTDCF